MVINVHKMEIIQAEKGMTSTELARRIGISRQNLSTIKTRGTCNPQTLGKIAKGLEVPADYLAAE